MSAAIRGAATGPLPPVSSAQKGHRRRSALAAARLWWRRWARPGLPLALACAAGLALAPAPAAAQEPRPFSAEEPAIGGTLVGNSGGAFHRFTIPYPGDGRLIVVTLEVSESRNTLGNLIGFEIFGPDGLAARGEPTDGNASSTRARATFSGPTPWDYLVQMYNYVPGAAIHYTISVSGLDTTAPISVEGASSPADAPLLRAGGQLPAGILRGSSGGAFRYFLLDYAGGTTLTATLTYSPAFISSGAIGLNLYNGEDLVAQTSGESRTGNTATTSLTYSSSGGAILGLQLWNYAPNHQISFSIDITGLGSPPIEISGNTTPQQAFLLTAEQSSVTGRVAGGRGGGFVFFLLNHPGNRDITIAITLDKHPQVSRSTDLGLNVYRGATLDRQAFAGTDSEGRFVASVTVNPTTATTYGIQVFNYSTVELPYRLNASGL